jgi:hypothetical protein
MDDENEKLVVQVFLESTAAELQRVITSLALPFVLVVRPGAMEWPAALFSDEAPFLGGDGDSTSSFCEAVLARIFAMAAQLANLRPTARLAAAYQQTTTAAQLLQGRDEDFKLIAPLLRALPFPALRAFLRDGVKLLFALDLVSRGHVSQVMTTSRPPKGKRDEHPDSDSDVEDDKHTSTGNKHLFHCNY